MYIPLASRSIALRSTNDIVEHAAGPYVDP